REGRARAAQGVHAVELGDAPVGGPARRAADLAGHRVPVRRDRPSAAALGDRALMRALVHRRGAWGGQPCSTTLAPTREASLTVGHSGHPDYTGLAGSPSPARRFALVTLIVLVFVGAGIGSAFAQAGDAQAGKLVYERKCALCHGEMGRGKEMYEAIECHKCHGTDGGADGPSRPELKDDWGNAIAPANLTMPWRFRGGSAPVDVATRLANGVVGTPMPSFIDSVEKPEDVWHLANYILSLGPRTLTYATLVSVTNVSDAIPDDPDAAFGKAIAPNHIALVGQVIVDPRNFNPSIELVSVRAVYHDKEIAFHLTWDDPTQSVEDAAKKTYADAI